MDYMESVKRRLFDAYLFFSFLMFNPAPKKQRPAAPRQSANTVPMSHIQYKSALTIISAPAVNKLFLLIFGLLLCSILQSYAFSVEYA